MKTFFSSLNRNFLLHILLFQRLIYIYYALCDTNNANLIYETPSKVVLLSDFIIKDPEI